MHQYVNCIAHDSSEGNLLIGKDRTALFDCGMAFCAKETIQKVKKALGDRLLDYIFITHTHYDHVGAFPFFKKEWPQVRLLTSEVGASALLKNTPRKVIREFSIVASQKYNAASDIIYNDDMFQADDIVKEKDVIFLGGISVEVIETPGHTRDSLSYFVPELELLIVNETPGVLLPDGSIYPCYLASYSDTINSIKKCLGIQYRLLSLSHRGLVREKEANGFFEKALETNIACRNFVVNMIQNEISEDEMLLLFSQKYGSALLSRFQPKEAFVANAKAMIACILRESKFEQL